MIVKIHGNVHQLYGFDLEVESMCFDGQRWARTSLSQSEPKTICEGARWHKQIWVTHKIET